MQLEDYFDFLSPTDIRLKGHRIGIDAVLSYYLEGYTPEEIAANLPTLSLEEIHATITYYLHNRTQIDTYLVELDAWREQHYQEGQNNPSPIGQRLRAIKTHLVSCPSAIAPKSPPPLPIRRLSKNLRSPSWSVQSPD